MYPGMQLHVNLLTPLTHVPCTHGLLAHSSMSDEDRANRELKNVFAIAEELVIPLIIRKTKWVLSGNCVIGFFCEWVLF